ncbi:acyltransferase [Pigmentiphaga litoralis]|uniref:Acetyltransferase-like isoleucine patch superfamily enzyme n=1 Tax=Pigmentiphaga litoralis TaxID=516702 RepID=A0A7Y9ISI0_9BURK|nr:acyltransferase [Pigmentiphaga litoralis]NYE24225.1 acetyltransferase-like isoleucine patch superfamily enzyme [Pigmentiphaga litoralis]NYE82161.1 acetyltransferase-like isoleucine patch superfamily enzyme [Pigmentiphaga litoralis]
MSLFAKLKKFAALSSFEKRYILSGVMARIKSATVYRREFGAIGSGTWLKRPRQVMSPKNIFIGSNVRIESDAILYSVGAYGKSEHNGRIVIEDGVYMNHSCNITCAQEVTVGRDVAFGPNVFLCDFDHGYDDPSIGMIQSPLVSKGPIRIGARSWIGANVYVASGVQLGEHCTVAANSVVTKSFPDNCVIAGVPAKLIKRFDAATSSWVKASATNT